MPPQISEEKLKDILVAVGHHPGGASRAEIARLLASPVAHRTLQSRLKYLVNAGRLLALGEGRAARYRLPQPKEASSAAAPVAIRDIEEPLIPLSPASIALRDYLHHPVEARKPVGYHREFLEAYRPNATFYLSSAERARLC